MLDDFFKYKTLLRDLTFHNNGWIVYLKGILAYQNSLPSLIVEIDFNDFRDLVVFLEVA